MKNDVNQSLAKLLADTYNLYLKTQNYHWHVKGENFRGLHQLFEEQYVSLADAVDTIAERIVTLGKQAPASFKAFTELTSIKEGDSNKNSQAMLEDLFNDHQQVINDLYKVISLAQASNDEGTVSLISERIEQHEKMRWMLGASKN